MNVIKDVTKATILINIVCFSGIKNKKNKPIIGNKINKEIKELYIKY